MNIIRKPKDSIFSFDDYKALLRAVIKENDKGVASRLAEAAGCQRSFLSDVLRTGTHITPDHAFGISKCLELNVRESRFFMNLVQLARASQKAYRENLMKVIAAERVEQMRLTKKIEQGEGVEAAGTRLSDAHLGQYYSSWLYCAVHIATSVPALRTLDKLSAHFRVPASLMTEILSYLVGQGMVTKTQEKYSYNADQRILLLSDKSPFARANHNNYRHLLLGRNWIDPSEVHYSALFSVSKEHLPRLREQVRQLIEEQRALIASSGCEELAVFVCDFITV